MDAKKSKFEYANFYGGYHDFAVNSGKYTKEQAIKIYKEEHNPLNKPFLVEESHVKWRAGRNEDGEKCVGWWFDYSPTENRSVKVWAFKYDFKKKRGI